MKQASQEEQTVGKTHADDIITKCDNCSEPLAAADVARHLDRCRAMPSISPSTEQILAMEIIHGCEYCFAQLTARTIIDHLAECRAVATPPPGPSTPHIARPVSPASSSAEALFEDLDLDAYLPFARSNQKTRTANSLLLLGLERFLDAAILLGIGQVPRPGLFLCSSLYYINRPHNIVTPFAAVCKRDGSALQILENSTRRDGKKSTSMKSNAGHWLRQSSAFTEAEVLEILPRGRHAGDDSSNDQEDNDAIGDSDSANSIFYNEEEAVNNDDGYDLEELVDDEELGCDEEPDFDEELESDEEPELEQEE
jgi:hypothetical protein